MKRGNVPEEDYDEYQRKPIWWYHTDHLGSSTYLTDNFGRPSHYYETLPFGEMMVEHNQSKYYKSPYPTSNIGKYDNKYKFNGKELDDATQMYYYGARYYDPRISIFVSVDPLAEKYPNYTSYHYVHNNPVNLIDPTGMEADGWIQWTTRNGDKQMTYDPQVLTEQGARDKGYTNVEYFAESGYYCTGNETYKLNSNGTIENEETKKSFDVGFNPFKASDGTYFSENNELKSLATGFQNAGDALTYTGLGLSITGVGAPIGGVLMSAGEIYNVAGTGIEAAYLISQGKKKEGAIKFAISLFFVGTGKLGVNATQKVAGKEAVKNGLNNGSETLIQGTNTVIEKTIGADTEDYINNKR